LSSFTGMIFSMNTAGRLGVGLDMG